MELTQWKLSDERKVIKGWVLYDLTGYREKGEFYRDKVLSILFQHGHILIRTYQYNILVWKSEEKRGRS